MSVTYYWKTTKHDTKWKIAFRRRNGKSIISDKLSEFSIFETEKGTWAADPFLVDDGIDTYLFMELFIEKSKKGVIAVSKFSQGNFEKPQIVIDEEFHLSFPCVFKRNNKFYMIPETGSQKNITLYEATDFPYAWEKKAILLEKVNSSDSIVFGDNNEYLLASILNGSTCKAQNVIYSIKDEKVDVVKEISGSGENGYRNAGLIFEENGKKYRPGQICLNGNYGKGIAIWEISNMDPFNYSEVLIENIMCDDIVINSGNCFLGIHTYNLSEKLEVIDLKYIVTNSFKKRIIKFFKIIIDYFASKK